MYAPLYLKTDNSLLSSLIKIDDLITYAKKHNLKALAITDDTMYGTIEFYNKCKKNKIKPIIGLEISIESNYIVCYAKNYNGYKNLIKLSTLKSEKELELSDLNKYSKDLLCIVSNNGMRIYKALKQIFDDLYIGYKTPLEKKQSEDNNKVFFNKILYINKEDSKYVKYLEAIKSGVLTETQIDNHFHIETEDKNAEIVSKCNLEIKTNTNLLPIFKTPDGETASEYIKKLCKKGLEQKIGKMIPRAYIDRLKYELKIISQMGFENYFLVVHDYIRFAKESGILVGPGRGSAAGSLVSYLLDITTIDPLKYNLLFERFLNPERISMPDIDIDFEYNRREEVINYCINKYGVKKVAPIITFGTLGAKQALRDVGRVMDIDIKTIDMIAKNIDPKLSLAGNLDANKRLSSIVKSDDNLSLLYEIALKLEGLKRHTSVHAAGIVMSENNLDEIIPLEKMNDTYKTAYSMEYLEELGLLKMDFLALKNLTLITEVLNEINKDKEELLSFDSIPLMDKKAFNLFKEVKTRGIFQFESDGMMNFLRKFKPETFEEIFAAIALFRPGPMDNIDEYIKRRNGKRKIEYYHESLEPILKPTYGIIIYQEQIMQIASLMANYTLGEADVLRKAMSKKKADVLAGEKNRFISNSIKNGYDEKTATDVFEMILKFASYGFNRAHSVAYAMISYKMGYLKANYPKYYMKALLNMSIGSEVKTKEYIYEAKLLDVNILKPDINQSTDIFLTEEFGIRYPLRNIKNVGYAASLSITTARQNGKFTDIFDFIKRTYGKSVNRKVLENLTKAGVFTNFGLNKKTIISSLDIIINYGELIKDLSEEYALKPEIKLLPEFSKRELMAMELEVFGFYLTDNPITEYKLKSQNIIELANLELYFDKTVEAIVQIDRIKKIDTKNGNVMAFISASDEIAAADLTLFPQVYEKYKNLEVGQIIHIVGKAEKRFDKMQIIVNDILTLE